MKAMKRVTKHGDIIIIHLVTVIILMSTTIVSLTSSKRIQTSFFNNKNMSTNVTVISTDIFRIPNIRGYKNFTKIDASMQIYTQQIT